MRLRVRLSHETVGWLRLHPEAEPAFSRRLVEVCADELSLVRETTAIRVSGKRYMQRCFDFGGEYLAVIEWNHAERHVRVQDILRPEPPPRAA